MKMTFIARVSFLFLIILLATLSGCVSFEVKPISVTTTINGTATTETLEAKTYKLRGSKSVKINASKDFDLLVSGITKEKFKVILKTKDKSYEQMLKDFFGVTQTDIPDGFSIQLTSNVFLGGNSWEGNTVKLTKPASEQPVFIIKK